MPEDTIAPQEQGYLTQGIIDPTTQPKAEYIPLVYVLDVARYGASQNCASQICDP